MNGRTLPRVLRFGADDMVVVKIDASRIRDWDSFHALIAETLGFPDFYGRNMNAWIDCLTYVDDPDAGMTNTHVRSGEVLAFDVAHAADLRRRCREIFEALVECSAFVNYRRMELGEPAVLALSFDCSI